MNFFVKALLLGASVHATRINAIAVRSEDASWATKGYDYVSLDLFGSASVPNDQLDLRCNHQLTMHRSLSEEVRLESLCRLD
jgi:hypothetical protein